MPIVGCAMILHSSSMIKDCDGKYPLSVVQNFLATLAGCVIVGHAPIMTCQPFLLNTIVGHAPVTLVSMVRFNAMQAMSP